VADLAYFEFKHPSGDFYAFSTGGKVVY